MKTATPNLAQQSKLLKKAKSGMVMTIRNVPKIARGEKTNTLRKINGSRQFNQKEQNSDGSVFLSRVKVKKTEKGYSKSLSSELFHPQYRVGDIAYIKEAIRKTDVGGAVYASDDAPVFDVKTLQRIKWSWKPTTLPSRFMNKHIARLFIEFTDVKALRVQEITKAMIIAEGVQQNELGFVVENKMGDVIGYEPTAHDAFRQLWNQTHNNPNAWDQNDWVFSYTYKLLNPKS